MNNYDSLFDADNRSEEAEAVSVKELEDTFNNIHKLTESDIIRNWYSKNWISSENYLELMESQI